MKHSKLITGIIFFLAFVIASEIIAPPDLISQYTIFFEMLIICGLLALIISRFKSFKQTPISIKKLIIVMVCLLTITITYSAFFFMSTYHLIKENRNLRTELSEIIDSGNKPIDIISD